MRQTDDYVLGTHDEEVARLGLQHRVWRPQMLQAWRRAGFAEGQTILDIGSGPGNATIDLAAIVGPAGRVLAVDKSRRFIDAVETRARAHRMENVSAYEVDLDGDPLPDIQVDGAWNRWVMSFTSNPCELMTRVRERLKPGAPFVIHEYFAYATWRSAPPSSELESFVRAVMALWRSGGGEPDLGLHLPGWLEQSGFDVKDIRSIVEVTAPGEQKWSWLAAFVESGRKQMANQGAISDQQSADIGRAFEELAADPRTRMVTPGLLAIIAVRR